MRWIKLMSEEEQVKNDDSNILSHSAVVRVVPACGTCRTCSAVVRVVGHQRAIVRGGAGMKRHIH